MTTEPAGRDYKPRTAEDRNGGAVPSDAPLNDLLQSLARAVRHFRTYPAASPMCVDAVAACDRAFTALDVSGSILVRITSRELIVGDSEIGRGTPIEQDLARPLHRARVASIEIDRAASPRDWSRFCADLVRLPRLSNRKTTLAELLADGGVATILARTTPRPEIVELGAPPPPVCALVERERTRLASAETRGPAQYFYPPEKGWVRFDPSAAFDRVSLVDLAVLVNEPAELATILMRLTDDDDDAAAEPATAIEQKYSDLVTVLSALDPRLARLLFAKLAGAVLQLDSERRRTLLRRTILPGLLDGRVDAEAVLAEFPDVDLADALCLLLDLETAAPDVLPAALERLSLTPERRAAVVPIIRKKIERTDDSGSARALDGYANGLLRVTPAAGKSFIEFSAFDLSINDATEASLGGVREAIAATDFSDAQLACFVDLARVEPNPLLVAGFLRRAATLVERLSASGRLNEFVKWTGAFAAVAAAVQDARPDVAAAIRTMLAGLVGRDLVVALAARAERSAVDRAQVDAMLDALGPEIVRAWAQALDQPADQPRVRPLGGLIADRAAALAPALAAALPDAGFVAARAIVAALGLSDGRYEALLASQLDRQDETLGRETLKALARLGTREAAAIIVSNLAGESGAIRAAAEEALWRLPSALATTAARDLLRDRTFVLRDPTLAARLLDRAARGRPNDLQPVLAGLVPLRFRFWNPALVRIANRAKELQQ